MSDINDNKFLASFILECVHDGKRTVPEICEVAESKIKEINTEINKIEQLRLEQNKFKHIVRQLSFNKLKTNKEAAYKALNTDTTDPITPYIKELCFKICNYIEDKKTTTPREIMDHVASIDENLAVYSAIKWLNDCGIIKRTGAERVIVAGDNWENKKDIVNV